MSARILIVEDHPLNRQLLRDLLRHRGYQTCEADSVEAARALLREERPELVLMDIQVPGGGINLLREIRADPELQRIAVAAVTALAMQGDREELLAAGFDAYVSKPIDTRAFVQVVEALLHRARS